MLFHYKKSQIRQAVSVALNMLAIPVILYLFQHFFKDQLDFEKIYDVVKKGAIAVAVVLAVILAWLLKRRDKFEIYVTEKEFYSHHPIFEEWCFRISPLDIVAIEHKLNIGSGYMTNINVQMKNGEVHQLCMNYPYSRKNLYGALKQVNPKIQLPSNANTFNHQRKRK
ncbi:hypothetical protein [uncultured Marinobacter sp.]|uniref:hypothetical protein n=1 Tax=uncultured Marinobacter sp. TaxID=187379 RepID=UPI00261E2696|nr:hypothetical protein [uncultured Marinobacter sp.]